MNGDVRARGLVAIAAAAAWAAVAAGSSVLYVDDDAPGGAGTTWALAFTHLQDALTAAGQAGSGVGEIRVAAGVYRPDRSQAAPAGTGARGASFDLLDGVAIRGGFAGLGGADPDERDLVVHATVLSGDLGVAGSAADNSLHVVFSSGNDATAVLDGVVVTAGNANGPFPGSNGGGLFVPSGAPTILGCLFTENSAASSGGAIDLFNAAAATITGCRFVDNAAFIGGAIGGMPDGARAANCVFADNSAASGGAIAAAGGAAAVVNCTVTGNSAGQGGGLFVTASNGAPLVTNCIVWGNAGGQIDPGLGAPTVRFSDVQGGFAGPGNIDADPLFADAPGGDLRLLAASPAIDAGSNGDVPAGLTEDLDGNPRILGPAVDLGAYEFNADGDADGLTDADELARGTDPADPDTDDDGLLDGTEVDAAMGGACPDPLAFDSDGDTLGDGDEVLVLLTDPCSRDTDGDGVDDDVDPLPTEPGVTQSFLEQELRGEADVIDALPEGAFNGPNANANRGRRNALASRVRNAANAVAAGNFDVAAGHLQGALDRVDGASPPPDWMNDSPEKAALRLELEVLLTLIELQGAG